MCVWGGGGHQGNRGKPVGVCGLARTDWKPIALGSLTGPGDVVAHLKCGCRRLSPRLGKNLLEKVWVCALRSCAATPPHLLLQRAVCLP